MRRPWIASLLFLSLTVGPVFGQAPEVSFEGARLLGLDVGLRWDSFQLVVGGGYELLSLGRDLDTGKPRPAANPKVDVPLADLRVLAKQIWTTEFADLWVGAGAVGQGDFGWGEAATGAFPDRRGGLLAYVQAGVRHSRQTTNTHGVRSGLLVEALAEVGPSVASVRGTDYGKAGLSGNWLLPLWDLEAPQHQFSGVLGLRGSLQWVDGQTVPVQQILPTEVRGYDQYFDAKLRTVATAELRVAGPSLWGVADVVPLALTFVDAGWYSGYANAPTSLARQQGLLGSVGAGIGVALMGSLTPTLTVALPLTAESGLWWTVESSLRF